MGAFVARTVPSVKGAVCYGLDEISKGAGARARLAKLRKAIAALKPSYAGLAEVFDKLALSISSDSGHRQRVVTHLKDCWFSPGRVPPSSRGPGRGSTEGVIRRWTCR